METLRMECKKHKMLKIIDKRKGGFWFLVMFIGETQNEQYYVCENCGKIFK